MRLGQFLRLRAEVNREARELAAKVRRRELSRAELERAVAETGDGEPALALAILDREGR